MKSVLISIFVFASGVAVCAGSYRESTGLEKRLAAAREEYYMHYDKAEAHFKFAGILYDAGCIESAFANVETLLRNSPTPGSKEFFDKYCRRKLNSFNIPPHPQQHKLSPEQAEQYQIGQLRKLALTDPAAAAFLRLAANPEMWRSKNPADIAKLRSLLIEANSDPHLQKSLQFHVSAASFLYITARDHENALPLCIRLYFHDPEQMFASQSPLGFTVNAMLQRVSSSRRNHLWIAARRDAVKFVIDNMHTNPHAVQSFFCLQKNVMPGEKFVKLCLLAADSVNLQLRTFAFGELMKRDLTPLLPMLKSLINDPDAGRRATAALLLPYVFSPTELPEALAQLARDRAAIVRMSAEAAAKKHCSAGNYARFREIISVKR